MIKIHYNRITGRVTGTEIMAGSVYNTDDCVDDISEFVDHMDNGMERLKDNLYFMEGELRIVEDAEPDYFDRRNELCGRIAAARHGIGEGGDLSLTEKLLSGLGLEEALEDIRKRKESLCSLESELEELDRQYRNDLNAYDRMRDAQILGELSPDLYSAVCLLIRDENQYLTEWIGHYIHLGIDLIVIYDNGIKERASDITDALEYDMQRRIEVIPFHEKTAALQQDAYNDFIKRYKNRVRWAAFVDSDEFIELADGSGMNVFLKQYEDYGSVHMNWVMYNANGQELKQSGPVQERFTREAPEPENHIYRFQGKDFIQLYKVEYVNRYHPVFLRDGERYMNDRLNLDKIRLKHYYTKSLEEWKNKMDRGSCDSVYRKSFREFFKLNPDMRYLDAGEDYTQEYGPDLEAGKEAEEEVRRNASKE